MDNDSELELRRKKILELKDKNNIPYKDRFSRTHVSSSLEGFKCRDPDDVLKNPKDDVSVAGRILANRDHGGIIFVDLQDNTGEVQIAIRKEVLKEEDFSFFQEYIDRGDFIGVKGEPFITKQGKLAVLATSVLLLSKAMRPLPDKYFGLEDIEQRYRKRYIDTILNEESRSRFYTRSKFVQSLREYLLGEGCVEMVTRTLQPYTGGALAESFTTKHKRLKEEFSLRISNELDLKMMVAGGYERVFEFAIDFRNEGIDSSHLQEFQMLEWYMAYENYEDGMRRSEEMLQKALKDATGKDTFIVKTKDGEKEISLKNIPKYTFGEILTKNGIDANADEETIQKELIKIGFSKESLEGKSKGTLLDEWYKKKVRPTLIDPVFLTDYPSELLPLARRKDNNPELTDSYQLVVNGVEIIKGYSELVDPVEQRNAFEEQQILRKDGDAEAMEFNEEFLTAIEHGIPPISGFGMGIDRMVALITGAQNLKESVYFPLLGRKE